MYNHSTSIKKRTSTLVLVHYYSTEFFSWFCHCFPNFFFHQRNTGVSIFEGALLYVIVSPLVFSNLWPFLCLIFSWAWHLKIIHLVDCLSIFVYLTSFQGYNKLLWFLQEYHRNDLFLIGSYHGVNHVHKSYWWFNWCMHINDMHTSYWWFSWMKLGFLTIKLLYSLHRWYELISLILWKYFFSINLPNF